MRCSALAIQNDNDHLADRPKEQVQAALDRLIEVGLCLVFEHQDRRFLCQADWQEFQKVEYPRQTLLPRPPQEVLQRCDVSTRQLFGKHPGGNGKKFPKISRRSSEEYPKDRKEASEGSASTRARHARESANGLRLEADGRLLTANGGATTSRGRFDTFWNQYPNRVAKEAARKAWTKLAPDDRLLATMLAALERQKQSPAWQRDNGDYIPHPATWLNQGRWQDEVRTRPAPETVSAKTQASLVARERLLERVGGLTS